MRTQDEIQCDIRELRRQLGALSHPVKKRSKVVTEDVRSIKLRAEILRKIKEFSVEYMAVLRANQI